ncbi:MAG TPA: Gfo/Idh/MocA family oxidoreductase [Candidatus Acidoferrales bacterium]|jgi:UDP-2-acetamido-3-amino-2,3-dideoxy-glucuronate N-acetyltransferase|nr:Gfo/Idh/MocA family oxidoreductase [Candidatus Acidoferrales bacterium]
MQPIEPSSQSPPSVAVVGSGYWGKNLVRAFHELGALRAVCDTQPDARDSVRKKYGVRTTESFDEVLSDPFINAVVIAAPAVLHCELARKAIENGKDVFVEKPLALRVAEARELVDLARNRGRILMVGHILEFHPAITELKRLISSGEMGKLQYVHSSRLNLGKLRTEENILWSFAPHDIATILYLLDEVPTHVAAHGGSYLNPPVVDTTLTSCEFKSGVNAHIFVSWLHPFKEQKLTIVADKVMAVFDDVEPVKKLMLYPHRINWVDRLPVAQKEEGRVVPIASSEPLRLECEHFLECVKTRQPARTDGESALKVLQILEACELSLSARGTPVPLDRAASDFYVHPTAVVDQPCQIGAGTKIWHFSHVMPGATLGKNCNLGQNVLISPEVKIGNNVKIQNNVSVYTGVELEDDVFCGPSMVFTNINNPRSFIVRKNEYKRTLIKRGATLGANSTIVCGKTVGTFAFVAAGAVVAADVADYALVAGVPARPIGWVCFCGIRLPETDNPVCTACGKRYEIRDGECSEAAVAAAAEARLSAASV